MGGNSISRSRVTPSTPKPVSPSQAKIDKLLVELGKLDAGDRKEAISALKDAGLDGLAKALASVVGDGGGSRPPERPAPSTYTPPA